MKRKDNELPLAVSKSGWRFHHLGIPTVIIHPNEKYLEQFKMYVSGFPESPYGIEWMRFEKDSPLSELIRTVPHIAFEVDNLEEALSGKHIISEPTQNSEDIKVAMIIDNGAPIELLEFRKH